MTIMAARKTSDGKTTDGKTTDAQKGTIARVMHEFKDGELERSDGEPVTDRRQAIAIALREAGASNQESPSRNRANFRSTRPRSATRGPMPPARPSTTRRSAATSRAARA